MHLTEAFLLQVLVATPALQGTLAPQVSQEAQGLQADQGLRAPGATRAYRVSGLSRDNITDCC